jgi:hypothetical protein
MELVVGDDLIGKTLEIFDASGKLVYQSSLSSKHVNLQIEISCGVYCAKINSGSQILTRKLIRL